ncbi:MAG: HEPN domain-containing protein [Actinobacteria bacterium]|nr:HEPN domain-containing protein [Actinomycetota bacterium]MCG2819046.1 HEPN domain-containing protein [Actinomycetes bacterium]MBU4219712.1 HEPN domain-containing protein [Actinomycetota bacterium]MBU4357679.1 HEPN domain-containing protein [Actinomycetota bacterium]MBU4391940.1 HEPN domain-containing protein [Actinomycetota bacterium]
MKRSTNIGLLIAKADESIEAAGQLMEKGHYSFASSRAYYTMYYAAEAVLLHNGLQFKKHSAVISNFNKEYVKNGTFPQSMSRSFQKAFTLRAEGDYGLIPIDQEEAQLVITEAISFVGKVREYLVNAGYNLEEE